MGLYDSIYHVLFCTNTVQRIPLSAPVSLSLALFLLNSLSLSLSLSPCFYLRSGMHAVRINLQVEKSHVIVHVEATLYPVLESEDSIGV